MVSPKVRPPKPHIMPQKMHQKMVELEVSRSTAPRSLVMNRANAQGAIIQLNRPPTSQKVSHDQRFTPRNGT